MRFEEFQEIHISKSALFSSADRLYTKMLISLNPCECGQYEGLSR